MGAIFKPIKNILSSVTPKAPDMPAPTPPPAPPSIEQAAASTDPSVAAGEEADARRRRRGRAATILTGASGAGTPTTATKALLGE